MAKRLTRYILLALVLGLSPVGQSTRRSTTARPQSAEQLKSIAEYLSIVTALFLRLIKMIIAPLVFSTLVAGIAHMGDIAALGRVGAALARLVHPRQPGLADPGPDAGQRAPSGRRPRPAAPAGDRRQRRRNGRVQPQGIRHATSSRRRCSRRWRATRSSRSSSSRIFFGVALTAVGEPGKPMVRGVEGLVEGDAPGHRLRDALRARSRCSPRSPARSPSAARRSS